MLGQFITNNQTNFTSFYRQTVEKRKNQVVQEYQNQVETFQTLRNKINTKFSNDLTKIGTNVGFTSFNWTDYFTEMYSRLILNAANVAGNVGSCCWWVSGNFWRSGYCSTYNPV